MSGFSKADLKNIIKGSIEPNVRKLICAIQESGMEVIKYCDEDGMVVGYLVPQPTSGDTVVGQFYDIEFTPIESAPAGSSPCSSEGFTTFPVTMEDSHPDAPAALTRGANYYNVFTSLLSNEYTSTIGEGLYTSIQNLTNKQQIVSNDTDKFNIAGGGDFKFRVDLNRQFTGIVKITISGTSAATNKLGFFSENMGEPMTLYDLTYFAANATDDSDGWWSATAFGTNMELIFYVQDIRAFTFFTSMNAGIDSENNTWIDLYETKTKFIREITNDGGTITTTDLKVDGTAYTVLGSVAEWDNIDTSLPYSDEVIGWDPNVAGGTTTATLLSNNVSVVGIAYADNIRILNVVVKENTTCTVNFVLHDLTSITHTVFGGSYNMELQLNQSPIRDITVTEVSGVSTDVAINYMSKTRF